MSRNGMKHTDDKGGGQKMLLLWWQHFWMTRIDKAKGHVVFICKRFYALALFRELGMTNLQSTNYMNIPRILMMTLEKYILMIFWVDLGFLLQKINIYHRDYALYMREYKGETIKLLSFYMTDLLFTEL